MIYTKRMSIGLLGLLYGMALLGKIDGSIYHSKKFTNTVEQSYTVEAVDGSNNSVTLYYADDSSITGVTATTSFTIPASQTYTVYYNVKGKGIANWKVTLPGYTFSFPYNSKDDIIDPSKKVSLGKLNSRSIEYYNQDDEDNSADFITVIVNQNDASKTSSFKLYNGSSSNYFYTVGGGSKNGISNIQIKDTTEPVKNTLNYGGHFEEVHVYKINGEYIIQCTGDLDSNDAAITTPMYQTIVNSSKMSIKVEALNDKNTVVATQTLTSGTNKFSFNNSVSLDAKTGAHSLRYSVLDGTGKVISTYTPAILALGSNNAFGLPHVATITSDLNISFTDYKGRSIGVDPISFKVQASATQDLTITNNSSLTLALVYGGTSTTFGAEGDSTAKQTIKYIPGTPLTLNASNLAVTIDPADYPIAAGSTINISGANNSLFITNTSQNNQIWEILSMTSDALPVASAYVNTVGTDTITLDNRSAQQIVVGVVKKSSTLQTTFGNFVTVPANGTVILHYDKADFALNHNQPSGFVVWPGLGSGVGFLDSEYLNKQSSIALTGTYSVPTDSVNNRNGYAYPKGTYNGQDVFVLIADKRNDTLGTFVKSLTAAELLALKSQTSDASIIKTFADANYIKNGGFVYSIGSSATSTASFASNITFDNIAGGVSIQVDGTDFGSIPLSSKAAIYYTVTDGATLSLVDASYVSQIPYGKKYVTGTFTNGSSTFTGILIPADATGAPLSTAPVPDGLTEVLTFLDAATFNALIKASLSNQAVMTQLWAQGVKTDGSGTNTASLYSVNQANYYLVVDGASLSIDAGALSGTLTMAGVPTRVFIGKIADYDATHHRAVDLDDRDAAGRMHLDLLKAANPGNTLLNSIDAVNYAVFVQ
jgi:hypothetical protein